MGQLLISPSLLAADVTKLGEEIKKIEQAADMLHIDVMDGHFVPNISYGVPVVQGVRRITDLFLDVHLMISHPAKYIKAFADAGSDLITIHGEAQDDVAQCIDHIHRLGKKAGIALNPDTPPQTIAPYADEVDMVLQMTVFPGFGGQSMIERAVAQLPALRQMIGPDKWLQVDGGIYIENCTIPVAAGANVLVSGTGIFGKDDPAQAIAQMKQVAQG